MDTKRQHALWWTLGSLLFLVCVGLILAAYRFGWTGTGFPGKTIWDWLQLLIIPLVLALVAVVFNMVNARTERQISQDKQKEDLLQAYLDRISELLLEKGLRTSQADDEISNVARVRTINILTQLDAKRIEYVFAFLREANLIDISTPIVSLSQANLSHVNWSGVNLSQINLSGANLSQANLSRANLSQANLSEVEFAGANLSEADLRESNLEKAMLAEHIVLGKVNLMGSVIFGSNLSEADFRGANLTAANLNGTNLRSVDLRSTDLSDAMFSRAKFNKTKLSSANFTRTYLNEAIIDKSQLTPEQIAQASW